jgi:lysophospholipase L1-like esterase
MMRATIWGRIHPARPRRRPAVAVEALEGRALLSSAAVLDWEMAPRLVADRGGQLALPNTPAYADPEAGYQVRLDASRSSGILPRSTFTWTITGAAGGPIVLEGKSPTVQLPEGSYTVRLEARGLLGSDGPSVAQGTIEVDDILIVSIGDSYASGEGNPVRPGFYVLRSPRWASSPVPAVSARNANAHRSTLAGPALFALALERGDPHTSVTFVSAANSGATIPEGVLGPMPSVGDPKAILPPEIDEVRQIVGTRPIDVLTVSIGGNDIGFSRRIEQLTTHTLRGTPSLEAIKAEADTALAALPGRFAALDAALDDLGPGRVLITEYPDPGRDESGRPAPVKLAGVTAIDASASQFAGEAVLAPLNRAIQAAASAHGWTYVGGISEDFRTHGYPSRTPWVRRVGESLRRQGDRYGAFHPNEPGHRAIAMRLLDAYNLTVTASA